MKKEIKMYLLLILAVLGFGMTSCTDVEDNAVKPEQPVVTDPVAQWLSAIPGVSDVEIRVKRCRGHKPRKRLLFLLRSADRPQRSREAAPSSSMRL